MLASGRPCASEMWPPATKSWPFDSIVWPEQNRFEPTGLAVNVLVAGSHRYGSPNLPHAKHLAGGQEVQVDGDDRPGRRRAPLADGGRAGDVERRAAHRGLARGTLVLAHGDQLVATVDGEGALLPDRELDLAEFRIAGRRRLQGLLAVLVGALDAPGDAHREGVLVEQNEAVGAEVECADRGVVCLGRGGRTLAGGWRRRADSRSQPAARARTTSSPE